MCSLCDIRTVSSPKTFVPAATANCYSFVAMRLLSCLWASASLSTLAVAAPTIAHDKRSVVERDGVVYNVFEHAGQWP